MSRSFTLDDSKEEILLFFKEQGYVYLKNLPLESVLKDFISELQYLVQEKSNTPSSSNREDLLTKQLTAIHKTNRDDFVHILDTAHSLPSFFGLCAHKVFYDILSMIDFKHVCLTQPPRIRLDFPQEDQYLLPDHQDAYYNEGTPDFVTIWIPLISVDPDMGGLGVRPASHHEGLLEYNHTKERPYFFIKDGDWQEKYPNEFLYLNFGEALVFHQNLIHKSGLNRGNSPRATIQIRFNNLDHKKYKEDGWPPSYTVVSKKDNL